MAGLSYDRQTLDNRMGQLVVLLRDTLNAISELNDKLHNDSRFADATLTAAVTANPPGFGYTQAEVDSFKGAFFALNKLNNIAHGADQQVGNSNFFSDADKLTGVM